MNTIGMRHAPHTQPSGWHSQNPFMLAGWLTALLFLVSVFQPLYAAAPAGQWWDTNHIYRQTLTVTTGASAPLNRYNGYTAMRSLNTSTLVGAGKLLASCNDLRVVWWNGSAWVEIDRHIVNCNTTTTQVWFKLQADIGDSASDDNYYLYYGNPAAGAGPVNKNNVYVYYDDFESYTLGSAPSGWVMIAGNATVENHAGSKALRMHAASNNTRINLRKDISPAERDILVEADCKIDTTVTANGYCGPGTRWSGTTAANESGYMGEIRYSTDQSLAQKYVTGTWGGVGTAVNETVTRGTYYRVRLTTVGTAIKMYRDGTLKVNATDSSLTSANMLGIDAFNASTGQYEFMDNYLARRFVEAEPSVAAASEEQLKTLSGTVYSDEGVTNIGTGKTVRMLVNGASVGTNATNASGQYSILAAVSSGDAILAYVDENDGAANDAATVTVSNGADLSGLNLYVGHVIVRHDNAGALSNALMNTAKGAYSDTEISYSVSAGNLTVSGSGTVLYVSSGHSYTPGANVTTPAMKSLGTFSGGSGSITVNGALTITGGSYTATSGTTFVSNNLTISGAAFTHNSGTFSLQPNNKTVNTGTAIFNHVIVNMFNGETLTVTGTLDVNGNLTILGVAAINGTISVAGNVTTTTFVSGAGIIVLDGNGNQTLGASGGVGGIPGLTINNTGAPAATVTIQDTLDVGGSGAWTYTAGNVNASTSVIRFREFSKTISPGSMIFNNVEFNIASGSILTVSGTMDINGSLTLTEQSAINGGTLTVAGNLISTDTSVGGTTAITLDGAGAQSINTGGTGDLPNGTLTINNSGTATLLANLTLNGVGQDITVTSGTLDLAGNNLVLTAAGDVLTVGAGATLRLQGGETVTATTKTFSTGSTVYYYGSGFYSPLVLGYNYHHLTFSSGLGTFAQTAPLTVAGNLIIDADFNSSGQNISIAGNWTKTGAAYIAGANTVTFNGINQIITGNTTFNNFTKSVAAADALTFAANSTTVVIGQVTLNGAAGQLLSLRSSSSPTRWNLNLTGTKSISYVDVQDGDASGSIAGNKPVVPTNSINSGNNIAWFGFVISGTVYTDEGVSLIGNGAVIRLLVNGTSQGTSTTAGGTGTYSITASLSTGDALLVYIDGHASKGSTATVSNGAGLGSVNIYGGHVITRHDNAGSLSNVNMKTAKGVYVDTDIEYSVDASNNLTVSGSAILYVLASNSYTPGANITTPTMKSLGTFNGGAATIDTNGALIIAGGSYTASSGTTNIGGDFTISAGTFVHNSGTLVLDTNAKTISIGVATLNHLTISIGNNNIAITGTIDVDGNLTISNAATINTGTIAVAGNVTTTDTSVGGSARILFDGAGNQILQVDGIGGSGAVPAVNINKMGGTLTINDTIIIDGFGTWQEWSVTTGTVNATASTVVFGFGTKDVTPGAMTFNNVTLNTGNNNLNVTGTLDINGNLTITTVSDIIGSVTIAGNLTSTDTSVGGSATLTLDGTGAQAITAAGTDLPDGLITINKASGVATLTSHLTLNGGGQNLTVTQGTFDLAGFNLIIPATLTVEGTLQLQGGETVTATTKTLSAGSTVIYNGGGSYGSLMMGNNYHHLIFNGAGSWTHTGALDVNGNLTITTGTLISSGQNVNVAGNWSNSGTYTSGVNTVTLDGSSQTVSGSTTFYNLTKSVTSADTLTFVAGQTQTLAAGGTLTLTGLPGNLLTLRSNSPGSAWFLNVMTGVAPVVNYVDVRDSNASGGQTIYAYYSVDAAPGGTNPNWVFGQQLQLVKQVWDTTGTTCLASIPSDGACSGGATAVAIPAGSSVYFFIYVRNPMAVSATDVRFQDLLDDTAFTYQTGSLQRTLNDGTAGQPSAAASAAAIFAAATTAQTDTFDGDIQIDEFAGINTAVSPDNLTVGGSGGVGQNDTLNVPANKSFAIRFRAMGN